MFRVVCKTNVRCIVYYAINDQFWSIFIFDKESNKEDVEEDGPVLEDLV